MMVEHVERTPVRRKRRRRKAKDDEGAKSKEHADDGISESEMKTSSQNRTNKKVSQLLKYFASKLFCYVFL